MNRPATLKVFRYVEELDAFLPTREYLEVAEALGLREWNPVVWIGRLFCMDNDFGEHWFDNWDLRDERVEAAAIRRPTSLSGTTATTRSRSSRRRE